MKSFSFKIEEAFTPGGHNQVTVRFGEDGQRALLGHLVMHRDDWAALRGCAGDEDCLDEVVLVPPGQLCPQSLAAIEREHGDYVYCKTCELLPEARGGVVQAHAWPHRWRLP